MNSLEIAINALKIIANPTAHLQNSLQEGEQLNGQYAMAISNDANWLKSEAEKALQQINKQLAGGQSAGVWIDPDIDLPKVQDKVMKPVLVKYETGTGEYKRIRHTTAYYFPEHFKNVEWEDWDDYSQEDFPYTEEDTEKGIVWLRPGWYQNIECEKCEGYWSSPMKVIKWMPIPDESFPPATTGEGESNRVTVINEDNVAIDPNNIVQSASTSPNATERQEGEFADFERQYLNTPNTNPE